MAESTTGITYGRGIHHPLSLQLVNWPLRQDGVRAWLMVALLLGVSAASGSIARSYGMGCLVFVALAFSVWRLWVPVKFELTSKGLTQSVLGRRRRIPWSEFARFEVRQKGVLLFVDQDSSPLAALRGVFIRWQDQRAPLLEILETYLRARVATPAMTRTYLE
jgi:hypothetical protein